VKTEDYTPHLLWSLLCRLALPLGIFCHREGCGGCALIFALDDRWKTSVKRPFSRKSWFFRGPCHWHFWV